MDKKQFDAAVHEFLIGGANVREITISIRYLDGTSHVQQHLLGPGAPVASPNFGADQTSGGILYIGSSDGVRKVENGDETWRYPPPPPIS